MERFRQSIFFTTLVIVVIVFVFSIIFTFPVRSFYHNPGNQPEDGFTGFSGVENYPDGVRFTWAGPDARLDYPQVPRYSSLNFRLRLNFDRPVGAEPARIEVYENSLDPTGNKQMIATLRRVEGQEVFKDYFLTIPPRPSGKGVSITFSSNTFKVMNDRRDLAFMFVESEVSLPKTHLLSLFWPNPFWVTGLLILGIIAAWSILTGLTKLETLLLTGMIGFLLVSVSPSIYQYSWWLLLIAVGCWVLFLFDYYLQQKGHSSPWWMVGAVALLLAFFLFSPDTHFFDIRFYQNWGATVYKYGPWNIYNNDPTLDYLPLLVYLLWIFNSVAVPLGLEVNDLSWRVFMCGFFMALVIIVALVKWLPNASLKKGDDKPQVSLWILLVGFNAAMFYNPAIYAQTDIIPILALIITFYFAYKRTIFVGGIALGLTIISKPQAWFVLPWLLWMIVRWCGWKKGGFFITIGASLAIILAAIAFGMDINSVITYVNRGELAGEYTNSIPTALNLSFLVIGEESKTPPLWLNLVGFGVVGLVMLWIMITTRRKKSNFIQAILGSSLLGTACFTFLIKMKERYLLYGMPFLGLAGWLEKKYRLIFLTFSWLHLLQLVISLYYEGPWGRRGLLNSFYLWSNVFSIEGVRRFLALAMIACFVWLAYLYFQEAHKSVTEDLDTQPDLKDSLIKLDPNISK
jgi:hypothetical protein